MNEEKLKSAIGAIRRNEYDAARSILHEIVQEDSNNEKAWLWLATCVETSEQKRDCLQRVILINPNNQNARSALNKLETISEPTLDELQRPISSPSTPPLNQPIVSPQPGSSGQKSGNIDSSGNLPSMKEVNGQDKSSLWLTGSIILLIIVTVSIFYALFASRNEANKSPSQVLPIGINQLGAFNNPIPIRTGYRFPGYGTMIVKNSLWKPGQTGLAIVDISFTCERPAGQECDLGHFMLDAIGNSGTGYKHDFGSSIPSPLFGSLSGPKTYGGATGGGYAGFLVTKQENSLIMKVVRV